MIPSQILNVTLEGSILGIISIEETYGYEISQRFCEFSSGNISEGAIYPLFLRLEKTVQVL